VSIDESRLRVHHLIDSLGWGGAEMLLSDLAAGAGAAGIDMSVAYLAQVSGDPAAVGLRARGVEPVLVPVRRVLDPSALPQLRRHLRQVQPDVVHTHLSLADTLVPAVARSLRIPSVSTIHVIAGRPTGIASDATDRGARRTRVAALSRRWAAARVIAVSDAARDAYLATGWDAPDHVVTVRNGISRTVETDPAVVRARLGLAPDALVVTTVSVLRPGKGHDITIEAVRRLLPSFPTLRLLILGDGPAREEIARQASVLGDSVLMPGHRDDVMAVLGATDVVVHATAIDAFPTALMEAAAASVPVVATRVGGVSEIVEADRSGFLVAAPPSVEEVTARLSQLLGDSQLRGRLGNHGRALFDERFSADRWAVRLRGVYEDVRRTPAPRRRRRAGSRSRAIS
jgi:glycosyltransferase involved in cell wall biosynthesis